VAPNDLDGPAEPTAEEPNQTTTDEPRGGQRSRVGTVAFKRHAVEGTTMSKATKLVLGTVLVAVLLSVAIIASMALGA
jgi:hypothetical protein